MRIWHHSLYAHLFIAFLLILLPVHATQFFMYQWGRTAVTEELNSAAASNVVYLRDHFVGNIQSINAQLEYLLTNKTVVGFYVNRHQMAVWDYYITILNINNLLALIKYSNPYFDEIILYYTSLSIALSSDGKIINVQNEDLLSIIDTFRAQKSLLTQDNGKISVGRMSPSTAYFNDDSPLFFVQAVLSDQAIRGHLSSFSQYSNKNALMINHNTGTVITSLDSVLCDSSQVSERFSFVAPRENGDVYSDSVVVDEASYIAVACYSALIHCSFVQLIPARTLQAIPNRFAFFMLLFMLLAFIVILAYSQAMNRLVKRPMHDLIGAFSITGSGDFEYRITSRYASNEFNRLANHFNEMANRIKKLISTNYEQTIRLQKSELKQLQTQINPHFLYNSFFLLRHMINRRNNSQARIFVSYLGEYFQYITKNGVDVVPLRFEYAHADNYLKIQMMRFDGRIGAEIDSLPQECGDIQAPRLILQPIFENIFEHGIHSSGPILIRMHISCCRETGLARIIIEDNSDRLTDAKLNALICSLDDDTFTLEVSGLINIHKRLQLHFGAGCGLVFTRSDLGGLSVAMTLRLPERKEEAVL